MTSDKKLLKFPLSVDFENAERNHHDYVADIIKFREMYPNEPIPPVYKFIMNHLSGGLLENVLPRSPFEKVYRSIQEIKDDFIEVYDIFDDINLNKELFDYYNKCSKPVDMFINILRDTKACIKPGETRYNSSVTYIVPIYYDPVEKSFIGGKKDNFNWGPKRNPKSNGCILLYNPYRKLVLHRMCYNGCDPDCKNDETVEVCAKCEKMPEEECGCFWDEDGQYIQ